VLKFVKVNNKDDEEGFYDIGLAEWLFDFKEDTKRSNTFWPPNPNNVQKYVMRRQKAEKLTWKRIPVKVKRFKGI